MVSGSAVLSNVSNTLNNLGEVVTITQRSASRDKWGSNVYHITGYSSTTAAPDNVFSFEKSVLPQGIIDRASLVLICKGDAVVSPDDLLTLDSVGYDVLSVEEWLIGDVVVAKQLVLGESHGKMVSVFPMTFPLVFS